MDKALDFQLPGRRFEPHCQPNKSLLVLGSPCRLYLVCFLVGAFAGLCVVLVLVLPQYLGRPQCPGCPVC